MDVSAWKRDGNTNRSGKMQLRLTTWLVIRELSKLSGRDDVALSLTFNHCNVIKYVLQKYKVALLSNNMLISSNNYYISVEIKELYTEFNNGVNSFI